MNGTEQRQHTKVTDDLKARLENVETVLAAVDDRVSEVVRATLASIEAERAARVTFGQEVVTSLAEIRVREARTLSLIREDREAGMADVEGMSKRLWHALQAHRDARWWQRVRWLIRGYHHQ